MASPVPRSAFFSFAVRVPSVRKKKVDGTLAGWSEGHRLPHLELEGAKPFADVWAAWQVEGLWLAVRVEKSRAPRVIPNRLTEGDCVEFYVDTRDVRTAHRAGRFCHKFVVAPVGGAGRGRNPLFQHQEIHRATASPATVEAKKVETGATVDDDRYIVELFLPSSALTGFDIEVNSRLGFAYVVHDTEHGTHSWPHPTILPQAMDPSLWSVAELSGSKDV